MCSSMHSHGNILMVSQEPGLGCGDPPRSGVYARIVAGHSQPKPAGVNQLSDAGICRWPASICWNLLELRKCERRSPSGVAGSWGVRDKSPVVRCAARPQVNTAALQVEMQLHDKSPFIRNRGPPMAISLPYQTSPCPLSSRCILLPPGPAASQTPAYPRTNPGRPSAKRSMNQRSVRVVRCVSDLCLATYEASPHACPQAQQPEPCAPDVGFERVERVPRSQAPGCARSKAIEGAGTGVPGGACVLGVWLCAHAEQGLGGPNRCVVGGARGASHGRPSAHRTRENAKRRGTELKVRA